MTKIVCISDTHNMHARVTVPECDILIHSGDFTLDGNRSEVYNFAGWMGAQPATHKIAIPGNHDFFCQKESKAAKQIFAHHSVQLLIDEHTMQGGFKIYGSPWQPWFYDWAFNFRQYDGTQATTCWAKIPSDTNILITHGPPKNILDRVAHKGINSSYNVGCEYLKERIDQLSDLKLHVFGHIHESYGMEGHNGIIYANASACNLQYTPDNPPHVINL